MQGARKPPSVVLTDSISRHLLQLLFRSDCVEPHHARSRSGQGCEYLCHSNIGHSKQEKEKSNNGPYGDAETVAVSLNSDGIDTDRNTHQHITMLSPDVFVLIFIALACTLTFLNCPIFCVNE